MAPWVSSPAPPPHGPVRRLHSQDWGTTSPITAPPGSQATQGSGDGPQKSDKDVLLLSRSAVSPDTRLTWQQDHHQTPRGLKSIQTFILSLPRVGEEGLRALGRLQAFTDSPWGEWGSGRKTGSRG